MKRMILCAAAALAAAACEGAPPVPAPASAPAADSALSIDAQLARFRDGMQEPGALGNAFASPDSAVRAMFRALEARDEQGLARLGMTRAEFAWLYYPGNPRTLPPYELDPGLMWMQVSANGAGGGRKLVDVYAGRRLEYLSHACRATERYGRIALHTACAVRFRDGGVESEAVLFGGLLEHAGRYKLISLANDL
ncbi:MAG TPA: hypothetical protein VFQ45_06760 [Longimicrobium sp.]|nr:hypothetical protein [Longimicrobium sp.]